MFITQLYNKIKEGIKYVIKHPLRALVIFLGMQMSFARAFNLKTLKNVHQHLLENQLDLKWKLNASNFARLELPSSLYADETSHNETECDRLRTNFWYDQNGTGVANGDENIHDHPYGFKTYIINGGYTHEIFTQENQIEKYPDKCTQSLPTTSSTAYFQYMLDKETDEVRRVQEVNLTRLCETSVLQGNTDTFDDQITHRVTSYKVPTLTINRVRTQGKAKTNFFFSNDNINNVKNEDIMITGERAQTLTAEAIKLYENEIERLTAESFTQINL